MIKIFLISTILSISMIGYGQLPKQGLKILLKEKTKDDTEILIKNMKVVITLNDTIIHRTKTNEQGIIDIETETGKYSVAISRDSCQTIIMTGIMVGINNRAYLTFELTCPSYINSLTKKELKKLGYKKVDKKI
jgi:hypothetical protein